MTQDPGGKRGVLATTFTTCLPGRSLNRTAHQLNRALILNSPAMARPARKTQLTPTTASTETPTLTLLGVSSGTCWAEPREKHTSC